MLKTSSYMVLVSLIIQLGICPTNVFSQELTEDRSIFDIQAKSINESQNAEIRSQEEIDRLNALYGSTSTTEPVIESVPEPIPVNSGEALGDGVEAEDATQELEGAAAATDTATGAAATSASPTTVPIVYTWPGPESDGYTHISWGLDENSFISNMVSEIADAVQELAFVYQAVTTAFSAWTAHAPIIFQQVALSTASVVIKMLTGADFYAQVGGSYIAYAYFGGSAYFNADVIWNLWSSAAITTGTDFIATALHEFGHVLGFDHVAYATAYSVMNPTIHKGLHTITDTDPAKEAVQTNYGAGTGEVRLLDSPVDYPPSFTPISAQTVEATKTLSFTVSATDPEGAVLTYSASNLPEGATFDSATRAFLWTPTTGQLGVYTVTFGVSDGLKVTNLDVSITVTEYVPPPAPPAIEPIPDMTITSGQVIKVPIRATDPDGIAEVTVSGPKGTKIVYEDGLYYVVWTAPSIKGRKLQQKSFNFTVTVTDTTGMSASDTFTVTVLKPSGALATNLSRYRHLIDNLMPYLKADPFGAGASVSNGKRKK